MATESEGVLEGVRDQFDRLSWVQKSLLTGAVLTIVWMHWVPGELDRRVVFESILMIGGPLALGLTHGRHIGWNVNRIAVETPSCSRCSFSLYLVGSTLPTIRAFYPIWEASAAPGEFVPHAIQLFVLALATETYYRGLLCVGVKELGFKAVFISPIVYMIHHSSKPRSSSCCRGRLTSSSARSTTNRTPSSRR